MNQYYPIPQKERKPSMLKNLYNKIFAEKSVKPITIKKNDSISLAEFYKKYGIIYNGSTASSCINSIL